MRVPTDELLLIAPTEAASDQLGAPSAVPAPRAAAADIRLPGLDPELAELLADPAHTTPADARELTRVLLRRLADLEEGTREFSYVRSTLIELNLTLVRFAIRRFGHSKEPYEDLLQVGSVGLIKAIDRFDPHLGVEFTTYAVPTIVGEIRRHFRDTTWSVHVPRRLQELRLDLAKAQDALAQTLDREPTVADLAEHLSISEEEVIEGLTAANAHTAGSLDLTSPGEGDGQQPAERLGRVDGRFALVENLVALKPLIAQLPERDREILAMRFGEDLTQSQIGARLGLSQMHVSRLLSRTLARLRTGLDATD
ncbi:SigB/SigF/SigG family RNA polymerase sigma factor [Kitasatospora cineracea]|uniref:RNA polymerase sigma-B factor n=1 Tax=Kitasatospora cineracea TaxID=88074 RepID=A0A3N4RRG2_9ACTN|nr:SigB/SigF/SigG family RNA polymerase sigma factor [Kitasatospora cineracea]RPE29460.1 RNA polymerase sigma-B factor [Kitasatospora cineracea]